MAEAVVLNEISQSVFEDIPALFCSAFYSRGGDVEDWFDLFVKNAAASLRAGSEFERIWNAEQIAIVRAVVEGIDARDDLIRKWAEESTAALREFGLGLSILSGELGSINAYTKAVFERACGDGVLPLDFDNIIPRDELLRFSPLNPRVPFVGRKAEAAALETFLTADSKQPFLWWIITGEGGSGKSRLARHLCLKAHHLGWRAGFLPGNHQTDIGALQSWQPRLPTLIVADYASARAEEIRVLAGRLGRRSDLPPVRLLLLDRAADQLFEQRFLGPHHGDRAIIIAARYADGPLHLSELSDDELWSLVASCPWRLDGRNVEMPRDDFFDRLTALDQQHRPLIAMILADVYALCPGRTGLDSVEAELRDLLVRERTLVWPAELGTAYSSIGQAEADEIIAFATMIGGLGPAELSAMEAARVHPVDRRLMPACARAIGKPLSTGAATLAPLEPDLLGEFFALEVLGGDPNNTFVHQQHSWMPATAWRTGRERMAAFATRAEADFPNHRALPKLATPVEGVVSSYRFSLFRAIFAGKDDSNGKVFDKLDADAASATAELMLVFTGDAEVNDSVIHEGALSLLEHLCDAQPDNRSLREYWAKAVHNVIGQMALGPERCREILDQLLALCGSHLEEPMLRQHWATSVANFVHHRAGKDPSGCRKIIDALGLLYKVHPNEPMLREYWATSVFNFANDVAVDRPTECLTLLNDLLGLIKANPDQQALRDEWAGSVINFIADLASEHPNACLSLLDQLSLLHVAHPDEPLLRESWARSAKNFLIPGQAAADFASCYALIADLGQLIRDNSDEPRLREEWANCVTNFIADGADKDPINCRRLLSELSALCNAHHEECAIRESWAMSIMNFITGQAADSSAECRDLLNELREMLSAHPDEPFLREEWAKGILFTTVAAQDRRIAASCSTNSTLFT